MKKVDGKRGHFWGCSTWNKTKCAGKVPVDQAEGRADALVIASRALSDKARKTRESLRRDALPEKVDPLSVLPPRRFA